MLRRRAGAANETMNSVLQRCFLLMAAMAPALLADGLPPAASVQVDFDRQIRPLLESRCQACHGAANQMSGLRLDDKAAAMAGGHSGPAILPGDSAGSLLIHMVAGYRVKFVMPPGGPALEPAEIGLLRAWIDQGAPWPEAPAQTAATAEPKAPAHWSWSPLTNPDPPSISAKSGVRNPIDRFVLAKLEEKGLQPSAPADRATLLRRLSLDLTGLPPTPRELDRFLADTSPNAVERTIDRLLRSPAHGEKWAMHWLDQVRYADSDGYEKDDPRPHAWRYRHWVIEALNADKPYDEFSIEQIAGDLLPHPTEDQLVATGFHRNTLKNREGGVNKEEFRFEETVDRASTIGTVWLGLTVGCAQCHDHKYDPISQKDFYRFYAFVNSIEETLSPAPLPGERGAWLRTHAEYRARRDELLCAYDIPELQPDWEKKVIYHGENPGLDTAWDVNWDTLAKMTDNGEKYILIPAEQRTEHEADVVTDYFLRFHTQVSTKEQYAALGFAELRGKLARLEASYPRMSKARTVSELDPPRPTHLHVRGGWDRPGVPVESGAPSFLPQIDAEKPTRLDLARWLFRDDNPLTARVTVNRIWQEYFGQGLVTTSDDFGLQGEKPSHPELLDWLARDFMESGWSLKHLHRRIVSSATYQQASDVRPELTRIDPDNRLLARQRRLRLPGELIRDSALAASGLLSSQVGGKSVKPPIPDGVTSLSYAGGFDWTVSEGPDRYRRGLYIHFQRTVPYPMLSTFDASERSVAVCARERSNTPLQALNLLNDPVFVEAAQGLATRVLLETPSEEFQDRLGWAYKLAFGRAPSGAEQARLERLYQEQMRLLDASPETVKALYPVEPEGYDRTVAAAWTGLSRVLLNTDELMTRE